MKGNLWLMATVRHRYVTGKHHVMGRAYLRLDALKDNELGCRDLLLPLDTRGRLHLRIDVEQEIEDMRFSFGRAFRRLKRLEGEMVRVYIDKVR